MSQSVTFTRSNGTTVKVDIDVDDKNASNISDDEARAAFDAARKNGLKDADLKGGQMTMGSTSLPADRYQALLEGKSAAPLSASGASEEFRLSRHQVSVGAPATFYGLNGGETAAGAEIGYRWHTPVSESGKLVFGIGPGVTYQKFFGKPSEIPLTQEDKETAAIGRDFTGRHLITPHLNLILQYAVSPRLLFGGLLRLGIGFMPGNDVTHRPGGDGYSASYCPPGKGGIFGDDATGCQNRPSGAFAQAGATNDSTAAGSKTFFSALLGPTVDYRFNDRMSLGGLLGLAFLAGDGPTRLGGTAAVALTFGLDQPTAAKPENPDKDGDGIPNEKDLCPNTPAGTKVDANGCPAPMVSPAVPPPPELQASVISVPKAVKPEGKLPVGVKVSRDAEVTIEFKDEKGLVTNTKPANVKAGESVSEFDVPTSLTSGKYKLIITMKDPKTGAQKVEEKEVTIIERVTADDMGTFPPNQKPVLKNIKVEGVEKLEGVAYEVEGVDKDGKSVGTAKGDKPYTIDKKTTQIIIDQAPEKKGFRKDVKYVLTLRNKDGFVILTKSFEIGEAPAGPKGGGKAPRL